MRVLLVTNDRRIYSTCRSVLAGLRNTKFELAVVPNNPPSDGDLYIWDYEADPSLQGIDQAAGRANIFLVEKENLSALRSRFDVPPFWTVLKPINPQLLESFISDPAIVRDPPAGRVQDPAVAAQNDDLLEALLESNLFLQQTDQNRNDLIAQGARELRMPLMAALGYCRMLLDQQIGPLNAEQYKVIQRMQQSMQRLLRLATSLFQSTGGAGGPMQARFQNGNFQECLDRAVAEITPLLETRNLTIHRKFVPPRAGFSFDPE